MSLDSFRGLAFAAIWISTAHSLQYLWVTSYYAKRLHPGRSLGSFLWRCAGAGGVLLVLPSLVFAPTLLGSVPWQGGLQIVLVSVVNLHHFVLDGAIWKLRDGRVARALLRSSATGPGPQPVEPRPSGRLGLAWAAGLLLLAIPASEIWVRSVELPRATRGEPRTELALRWLHWTGRAAPGMHLQSGHAALARGDLAAAEAAYRRGLDVGATAELHAALGVVLHQRGRLDAAAEQYAAALDVDGANTTALSGRGVLLLGRARAASDPEHASRHREAAIASLEQARDAGPLRARAVSALARAYADAGRVAEARAVLEAALRERDDGRQLQLSDPGERAALGRLLRSLERDTARAAGAPTALARGEL